MNHKQRNALLAKLRQDEIKKKQGRVVKSGHLQSSHQALTNEQRLIDCDHYKLQGTALKMYRLREDNAKKVKEIKALTGIKHKHVKRDENGKTLEVSEVYKN